jgi:hypothetical protein
MLPRHPNFSKSGFWAWLIFFVVVDHAQKSDPRGQGQKSDFVWTHNLKSPFFGLGKFACRIALLSRAKSNDLMGDYQNWYNI